MLSPGVQLVGPKAAALGILEGIWAPAYEAGNDVIGDEIDVAFAADWTGKPQELVDFLLTAGGPGQPGFIDVTKVEGSSVYRIHDFWHHAPDYVRKRRYREQQRKNKGDSLKDGDRSPSGQSPVTDNATDRPPAPAPAPITQLKKKKNDTPQTPLKGGERDRAFDAWYKAYPKRQGRRAAKAKWDQLWRARELPPLAAMLAKLELQITSADWIVESGQYIPLPTTYLNRGNWDDEVSTAPVARPPGRTDARVSAQMSPKDRAAMMKLGSRNE